MIVYLCLIFRLRVVMTTRIHHWKLKNVKVTVMEWVLKVLTQRPEFFSQILMRGVLAASLWVDREPMRYSSATATGSGSLPMALDSNTAFQPCVAWSAFQRQAWQPSLSSPCKTCIDIVYPHLMTLLVSDLCLNCGLKQPVVTVLPLPWNQNAASSEAICCRESGKLQKPPCEWSWKEAAYRSVASYPVQPASMLHVLGNPLSAPSFCNVQLKEWDHADNDCTWLLSPIHVCQPHDARCWSTSPSVAVGFLHVMDDHQRWFVIDLIQFTPVS